MKDIYMLAPLIFVIFSTALGFFVYERDTKNPRNYFFLALMCVYVLFCLFEIKAVMAPDSAGAKLFILAQALPAVLLPPILFCFNNAYCNCIKIEPQWLHWFIVAPFLLLFLALAKLLDAAALRVCVSSFGAGFIVHIGGVSETFLMSAYIALVALSFWPYFKSYRLRSLNHEYYVEIKSIFYSIFVPLASAFAVIIYYKSNVLGFGCDGFIYPLALFPLASFFSTLMLTVTIIKHRSFNISIIFNNALIYSLLAIVISGVYVVIQNFLENFFQRIFNSTSGIYGAVSALIVAFLFEPLNRKINDFINNLIEFFKTINSPVAGEDGGGRRAFSMSELKSLEISYLVFIFCFITIFVAAKFIPGMAPKVSYMISSMTLSFTSLYILYKILLLPFNMLAYVALSMLFAFTHVTLVAMSSGVNFYIQAVTTMFSVICLISAAGLIGRIIAARIDEVGFLVPLCIVAAAADLWSVFYGVTSELITKKSVALEYLLIRYPTLSSGDLRQYIGIADFLFATIFMGCAMNFKLNVKKTYVGFTFGFFVTFMLVVLTHRGIPAIPVLAFMFMAVNGSKLKISFEDVKTTFIVIAGSAGVFYLISILRRIINR